MRIFLVRHGESMGNVDKDIHRTMADHAISLSPKGVDQAQAAGLVLGDYLSGLGDVPVREHPGLRRPLRPRMWVSPYLRTRQTADGIESTIGMVDGPRGGNTDSRILDRREHMLLVEQQFGLFDGLSDEECAAQFPAENDHYLKQRRFQGRFWAPMPLGESRFQVAQRVHQAFGTFHRDAERHGIENIIVVSHGVTLRCFVMMWLHLPFEWIEKEPNPKNCSIRLIDCGEDKGYIYPGE